VGLKTALFLTCDDVAVVWFQLFKNTAGFVFTMPMLFREDASSRVFSQRGFTV